MTGRKAKGDMAEGARQTYWESKGAVVFPVSPSYPGVDLIVFGPLVWLQPILLSEVKGQKAKLYGKAREDAHMKLWRARGGGKKGGLMATHRPGG